MRRRKPCSGGCLDVSSAQTSSRSRARASRPKTKPNQDRMAVFGLRRRATAANLAAGAQRRRLHRRIASQPSDLDLKAPICFNLSQPDQIPVNHDVFSKELLYFF